MDIFEYLKETYKIDDDFNRDINLIECGILDSMGLIELLYYLEDNDIIIHLSIIGIDNFNTINKINCVIN